MGGTLLLVLESHNVFQDHNENMETLFASFVIMRKNERDRASDAILTGAVHPKWRNFNASGFIRPSNSPVFLIPCLSALPVLSHAHLAEERAMFE